MAESKEIPPKIFVFYTSSKCGEYISEQKAIEGIRARDFMASEVVKIVIGHELSIVGSVCLVPHCFTAKSKARKPQCKLVDCCPEGTVIKLAA